MIRVGWHAWIWGEGGYLPCESVPLTDVGFRLGYSAFETIAVRDGVPLFLAEHLSRLIETAEFLGLTWPPSALGAEIIRPVLANLSGMARLYITGGDGLDLQTSRIYLLLENRPFPAEESYQTGWKLRTGSTPHAPMFGGRKTGSYAAQLKVNVESHLKHNVDETLLFNEKEELISAAFSNVFWVQDGQLMTPPKSTGARAGVVREWVMNHFPVTEQIIHRASMEQIEEIFLTNSRIGIMSACELDGRKLALEIALKIRRDYFRAIA